MRVAPPIVLTAEQEKALTKLARSNTTSVRLAHRAKIVLLAARGHDNTQIAGELGVGRVQAGRWRERYAAGGLAAIEQDLPRGGRKPKVDAARIVHLTTQTLPAQATHWSTRRLAQVAGVSDTTVLRVWHAHGLKPHRVKTFKVSRDPKFVEKLEDVVGLYLNPPEHALVLCCDEKSQVQALDRTQPGLPLKKGRAATMTHDYKRHGTTTLFAALNVLDGTVIGQCQQKHTHVEWLKFLRQIDRETPKGKTCLSAMRNKTRAGDAAENSSKGCGGVMRVAPVGLLSAAVKPGQDAASRDRITFQLGCEIAGLTHGHPTGQHPAGYLSVLISVLADGVPWQIAHERARRALGNAPSSGETATIVDQAIRLA